MNNTYYFVVMTDVSIDASDYAKSLRFHEFLKLENEIGNITRQEAVSMVGHFICSFNLHDYTQCLVQCL